MPSSPSTRQLWINRCWLHERRDNYLDARRLAANTFEAVAREWHKTVHIAKVSEGHAERTLIRLEQDAFPWIGATPIAKITAPKLLEALRKIEARGAIETAHRVPAAPALPMPVLSSDRGSIFCCISSVNIDNYRPHATS